MLGTYAHCNIGYAKSPLLSQRSKTAKYDHARFFVLFFSFSIWDSLNSGISGADFHTRDANWQSRGVFDAVSDRDNDLQAKIGRQGCLQGQKKKKECTSTDTCVCTPPPTTHWPFIMLCVFIIQLPVTASKWRSIGWGKSAPQQNTCMIISAEADICGEQTQRQSRPTSLSAGEQ